MLLRAWRSADDLTRRHCQFPVAQAATVIARGPTHLMAVMRSPSHGQCGSARHMPRDRTCATSDHMGGLYAGIVASRVGRGVRF